jgi:hypothetical protein
VLSCPSSFRQRWPRSVLMPQDLAATTTLVLPCSGLVFWSALATWSAVFLLVSTVAVLPLLMPPILACTLLLVHRIHVSAYTDSAAQVRQDSCHRDLQFRPRSLRSYHRSPTLRSCCRLRLNDQRLDASYQRQEES